MGSLPFTVYDIIAYLSSGTVVVALADYVSGQHWLSKDKLPPGQWVLLLIFAYVVGHVVAHLSTVIFEQGLVQGWLKRPSRILMGSRPDSRIAAFVFRGYYRSLPEETRNRILAQAQARGFAGEGEGLFLHAYAIITKDERSQKRLDEFRNIYGFARNMAFSLLVAALILGITFLLRRNPTDGSWSLLSAAMGITMLYRYLKFFRQYSYQLFVTYAEQVDLKAGSAATGSH
jgi:hypothetical protein